MEVVLACDIRIAAENARLGVPEVRLGLIPGWGATARLPRMMPYAKAAQLLLTGQPISAQEALSLGLVNEVVPLPQLIPTAEAWARRIMECAPLSARASKQCAMMGLEMPLDAAMDRNFPMLRTARDSEDWIEGLKAFAEKRKPVWKGR